VGSITLRDMAVSVPVPDDLARRIAHVRVRLRLTQAVFAARIGTSRNMVSLYERGAARPRAVMLDRIAKLGGMSIDRLLNGSPHKPARRDGRGPAWDEAVELLGRAWQDPTWRRTVMSTLRALRPLGRG
jgi:transcriptional regulator with XRE-family HTH domain